MNCLPFRALLKPTTATMEESNRKTETLVGLFIVIGLTLMGVLIVQFGSLGDSFATRYPLTVIFDDAAGLIKGSEVRMGGAQVGKVAATPKLNEDLRVEVALEIQDHIKIPKDSLFQIGSASLLGDKLIVITPSMEKNNGTIAPESVIQGSGSSGLDSLQRDAEAVSRNAQELLVETKDTMQKIKAAIDDIQGTTSELSNTIKRFNTGVLSDSNLQALENTFANLENASSKLDPVLTDARATMKNLNLAVDGARSTFDGARSTFDEANQRLEELGPAFKELPNTLTSLTKTVDDASDLFTRIEEGKGLIGTLAYDEEISDDAKTFVRNLKKQGILRYRDKETSSEEEEDPRERFKGRRR